MSDSNSSKPATDDKPSANELNELERLRDILYGQQARTTDKRLLEFKSELEALEKRFIQQLAHQQAQSVKAHQELEKRIEKLGENLSGRLDNLNKDLSGRLDSLDEQTQKRDKSMEQNFNGLLEEQLKRMEHINSEQTAGLHTLQEETRQRDENLHQELLALAEALEAKKVSRQTLGQALADLGQRLQSD